MDDIRYSCRALIGTVVVMYMHRRMFLDRVEEADLVTEEEESPD